MKYEIEKDKVLNTYIVWEVHTNYKIDRFRGYKYQCKSWVKKMGGISV